MKFSSLLIISLLFSLPSFGQPVKQPPKPQQVRKAVQQETTEDVAQRFEAEKTQDSFDIALGLTAGHNYFYPNMHFQLALTRNWSLGLMPVYASYTQNNNSVKFYGGFATLTYYHTHFAFKGFNFELGAGYFSIGAKTDTIAEQTVNPVAVKLTAGWRGRAVIGVPVDIGASLGGQYVFLDTAPLDISYKKLLPMLSVYVAYPF